MNRYDVTTPFNLQFDSAAKITLNKGIYFCENFSRVSRSSTTEFHGKKEIIFNTLARNS